MSTFTQEQEAILSGGDTSGKSGGTFDRLLKQESGGRQFNTNGGVVTSSKGATGIAQVMPATGPEAAKLAGVEWNPERFKSDPEYNKSLGRAYFDKQLATFGNERLALAAYNAGPGAVQKAIQRAEKSGGDPLAYLPEETQKYVPAILGAGFGVKREAPSPWSQQPKYVDPGFKKAAEQDAKNEAIANEGYGAAFAHGFGDATDQIPEMAVGAGTALADVFGADELRDAGLEYLQKRKEAHQDDARPYSSFTDSLTNGDMGRWAASTLGYGLNQLAQAIATGGVGSTIGKVGLTGLLKGTAERVTAAALAKGATAEVAGKAGMEAAEIAARKYGAAFSMSGYTYGQELGSIYPDAVEQAKKTGNPVDLARVFGAAGVAAALEVAPEIGIAGKLIEGVGKGSKRMAGRAALTVPKQMGLEGGTEYLQTGAEQWGAQKPLDTPEAQKERIDSAAMGAIMGGPAGAIEAIPAPRDDSAPAVPGTVPGAQPAGTPPAQPAIQPNSPLGNAAGIAQAAAPQPAAVDPFDGRVSAMQSFVEDKAFIQALRGAQGYGPESVTEALSAFAKARNPNLDPMVRERALSDLEGFVQSFNNRPNFTFGAQQAEQQPRQQVVPFQQPGGDVGPAITPDDGRTLNGEVITRPSTMAGANPNQISAPPVLGLPTEEALQAKRDADAAYEQAYQDLVKSEQLGESDAQIMARQQAIREARAAREQADARMREIEQAIEGNRTQQTTEKRRAVLDAILADPATANPAARLAAELKRQGFRDTTPTQAELDTIQRFSDIKNAEAEPDIIPSSPNELDPYQARQERAQPPAKPRLTVEQIKQAIANGATLSKDVLTLPDGSRVKLKGPQIAAAREAMRKASPEQVEPTPAQPSESAAVTQEAAPQQVEPQAPVQAKPNTTPGSARLSPKDIRAHIESGAVLADSALTLPDGSRVELKGPQIAAARQAQLKKARTEPAKPAPVEPKPTAAEATLASAEPDVQPVVDPLDKEISDAAAHLADVLADVFGAKLNITGPQHTAADLLPAMQKVIGLLVQKGFKTFAQAVGQTARMLRDNGAGEHVEKITPRQWKAAYQFAADMPGVEGAESEEAVAALSSDKVQAIVSGQVDKAKAEAEARTDTNPSEAQKTAENYRKGKFSWNGQTIAVENPKGSERTGKGEDGAEWRTVMPATYGYFLGTVGSDGDHVDVFMGDTLDAPSFWVINQTQPDSTKFDEHKVVAGVTSADEAKRIYLDSFSDGFGDKVFSSIAGPYPVGELADVLPKLKAKKPFGVKKESPRDAHIRAKEEAYTARREGQSVPPKALEIVRTEAGKEFDKAEATHKDPGQPAEAVTPAVVAESIRKSAANTPLDVKEAKAYLLAEIDKAILAAGDKSELEAELAREKAREFKPDGVLKRTGGATLRAAENDFEARKADAIAKTAAQISFVTFDVPGDGKFKVANSAAKLQEFRRKVETSPGFKEPAKKPPTMRSETNTGSYGPRDAILEGDYLNAYELAKLQDKPLAFSVGTNNQKPTAYTDTSTADGIIDGIAFVVGREATKDGKWFVIEPATGILLNKNGLPSKVAALTASKAITKGKEDGLRRVIADPAKAMPQSTLEAEWLAWAEKEEGITRDRQAEAATNERENADSFAPTASNVRLRDTSALRDGESIPRDQAEAFIRSFVAEFPGAPPIMLADSFSQLPKELQADAISQGSSARRAKGALKDGKAFVVLNNHHSMADLEATVFHEILGHTGTRKLLGPQFSQELNKLFVGLGGYSGLEKIMQARGMGQQFEGYFKGIQQARASNPDAWTDALAKSILTEEAFAHIAEQKNAKQLRDRFMALVGMVRDWLRRHGFMDLARLGESDIVFMLQHAREGLRDGSGIVRDGATVGENEIVGEDGRPIAKEGSPEYEALKLLSGRLGLRERSGPTVFRDEPAEESPAVPTGDSKQEASPAVFRTDTYAQPRGQVAKEAMGNVISAFKEPSAKVFNTLHKTVATQLHKASVSKDYAEVFGFAQEYMNDTARFAADPAAEAPNLLPTYDSIKQAFNRFMHGDKNAKLKGAVADAIFQGTLAGEDVTSGRVWTDDELRSRFGHSQEQIDLYREARAAIDASLDAASAGLAWQTVKKHIPHVKGAIRSEPGSAETIIDGAMRQAEEELREVARYQATVEADGAIPEGTAAKTIRKAQDVAEARKAAESIFLRSDALKAGGYAPLMRFGKYSVDAVRTLEDGTQERIGFYKFETEIEAKMAAQELQKEHPDAEVTRSVMSEEAWKIFKGVDPDLVAMFAETLDGIEGLDVKDEVLQEWYRSAVNERSSFKRMVHRKGTEGFDTDITRVLASFITSNSRLAARQFNMGDISQSIASMQDRKVSGDVVDEAMSLKEYMDNPEKPFKAMKGIMFAFFLGGSVASALLNLTQPIMMTMPYLSQFGAVKAGAALANATKEAASGKVSDPELSRALARASKDGVVDPQQIHHLYQEGMRSFIMKLPMGSGLQERAQGFMTMWGMMFGATENFNRRLTFIAAYRMARENPELGNPYDFAAKAVNETQGIYNDANIPNWARGNGSFGAVGVAAFTFKQYSIGYVELLIRLAKSGKNGRAGAAMMLGTLVMMSGMQGAPGADDLEDIIDTVSQYLGYTGNSRLALRKSLESGLGSVFGQETAKAFAHIVMYGGLSVLPGDLGGRIGMGNLIPASALAKPSEQNRGSQVAEIFGPPLGLATQVLDAGLAAESGGGILGVAKAFAPVAVRNWMKAYDMASTGQYSDARGRKVVDVTLGDAALKLIGIQPTVVADDTKDARLVNLTKQRIVQVKSAISSLKAQAIADRDPEMKAKADAMVTDWNQKNPDAPIRINDGAMLRRVKEINTERRERLLKAMPKDFRAIAAENYN